MTFAWPLVVLLALAAPTLDDMVAPDGAAAPEPVGGGLLGAESVVALEHVTLSITLGRETSDTRASYVFKSTIAQPAYQSVGFADAGAAAEAARKLHQRPARTRPASFLYAAVNDQQAATHLTYAKLRLNGARRLVAWRALPMAFPPGQEVQLSRQVRAPLGQNGLGLAFYDYQAFPARIWHGPIARLEAHVTLVEGLTADDLLWAGQRVPEQLGAGVMPPRGAGRPAREAWHVADPTHLDLTWEQFEPFGEHGEIALVFRP